MAAPFHSLQQKLEEALKSVADAVPIVDRGQAQVFAGVNNDDLPLPRIVVMAEQAEEFPVFSGNHNCQCSVMVLSTADPKTDTVVLAHRQRTAFVFDAFFSGTLAVDLSSAVSDFTCLGVYGHQVSTPQTDDRHWTATLQFTAYVAPSDL
jgi:hypothetical protein